MDLPSYNKVIRELFTVIRLEEVSVITIFNMPKMAM